jgi:hypothetical protein
LHQSLPNDTVTPELNMENALSSVSGRTPGPGDPRTSRFQGFMLEQRIAQ